MSTKTGELHFSFAVLVAQSAAADTGFRSALAVSPGAGDRLVAIGDGCPTFNWGSADGAAAYELLVVELASGESATLAEPAEGAQPVLPQTVPGGALGWTPSLESCFRAGGAYAWFVRAHGERSGDPAGRPGEWSEPLFFRVDPQQAVLRLLEGLSEESGAAAASAPEVRRWIERVEARAAAPVAPPAAPLALASPGATAGGVLSSVTGALTAIASGPFDNSRYGVVGKATPDCFYGTGACNYSVGVYGETAGSDGFVYEAGVYGYSPSGLGVRGIGGFGATSGMGGSTAPP